MKGKSFSSKIAYRYLTSKRSEAFISILTVISTGALAIGVAVLIIVMSIMNGFEHELKSKLLGTNAHISVKSINGRISDWGELGKSISVIDGIESSSPYIYQQALLQINKQSSGVLLRGILPNSSAGEELNSKLISDAKLATELFLSKSSENNSLPGIVIGRELAKRLHLVVGDTITILSPQVQSSPLGIMPRFRRFSISGIYSSGLVEYESSLVYVSLDIAQQFFRMNDAISGFEVRIADANDAPKFTEKITDLLASTNLSGVFAESWTETNKGLWEALRLERAVYYIVLLLLIVMASFSIVSTLVMLVLEKRKDIAVFRTLGATSAEVGRIFRSCGLIIGIIGTVIGVFLGLLGNFALKKYGFPLPENVFPVSTVPVKIDYFSCLVTACIAILICYLATIYPAKRASNLRPTDLLRYE